MSPEKMKPYMKAKTVGEFFAFYREKAGISQGDLAKILGCQRPYISQIEADKYDLPVTICRALAKRLDKGERDFLRALLIEQIGF